MSDGAILPATYRCAGPDPLNPPEGPYFESPALGLEGIANMVREEQRLTKMTGRLVSQLIRYALAACMTSKPEIASKATEINDAATTTSSPKMDRFSQLAEYAISHPTDVLSFKDAVHRARANEAEKENVISTKLNVTLARLRELRAALRPAA